MLIHTVINFNTNQISTYFVGKNPYESQCSCRMYHIAEAIQQRIVLLIMSYDIFSRNVNEKSYKLVTVTQNFNLGN